MTLLACSECFLRLLSGTPGDFPLAAPGALRGAERSFQWGITFWFLAGFMLEARLDSGGDDWLPRTKLSCDVCHSVEWGPRFGIGARDIHEKGTS